MEGNWKLLGSSYKYVFRDGILIYKETETKITWL